MITGWAPLAARLEASRADAFATVRELLRHFGFVVLQSFAEGQSTPVTNVLFAPLGERAPPHFGV
jgi:hypothetical protein